MNSLSLNFPGEAMNLEKGTERKVCLSALIAALAMLATTLVFLGCAGSGGNKTGSQKEDKANASAVKVDEGHDLADLAKAIKTPEDAQVLDLLLGYRMLVLHNPDPKSLDKETLKKSRQAYDMLEAALRHGGIKAKENGERVYSVTNEERLSFQEVIHSASQSADKNVKDGDWEKARARWKEIVQSKAAIAFIMEEAQWGLTLSDALQSTLADSLKKRLKDVNESYAAEINHDEINKQVKVLLEQVPDVKIQRELKKLANRSWDRDRRNAKGASSQLGQSKIPDASATVDNSKLPNPVENPLASGAVSPQGTSPVATTPAMSATSSELTMLGVQADTLAAQGRYIAALKMLDKAGDQAWVKEKKNQIGDRYCEEKRKAAAGAFKDFKKAVSDSLKKVNLNKTASELDSCLFYFPELPVSQKVRKNREMVETEMKKLKP